MEFSQCLKFSCSFEAFSQLKPLIKLNLTNSQSPSLICHCQDLSKAFSNCSESTSQIVLINLWLSPSHLYCFRLGEEAPAPRPLHKFHPPKNFSFRKKEPFLIFAGFNVKKGKMWNLNEFRGRFTIKAS